MRTLEQSLQEVDSGRLLILAELWGLELPHSSAREMLQSFLDHLADSHFCQEMYESLPEREQAVLAYVRIHNNQVPVPEIHRRFGVLRQMGSGRRDREKPWRHPDSPLEMLWYRGWISKAFDHTSTGLQEFYFIPEELLPFIPQNRSTGFNIPGAASETPPTIHPGSVYILEDCTTLLADLRRSNLDPTSGDITTPDRFLIKPKSKRFLIHLLKEKGVISSETLQPHPAELRSWFETSPHMQWVELVNLWENSTSWNDLALVPSLTVHQDHWPNDPFVSRKAVLDYLRLVPEETWWNLDYFLQSIREEYPAFQRPGNDFDSWYLQSRTDGAFLTGFQSWDAVEGALIRTMIRGPLFWLGLVDLGIKSEERWISSFRINHRFSLLRGDDSVQAPIPLVENTAAQPVFAANGEIHFPLNSKPALRYQVARAAEWEAHNGKAHRYYFTPASLEKSARLGLHPGQLLAYLQNQKILLPPYLETALRNWENSEAQATIQQVLLLQVSKASILTRLLENRSTAKYLGRQLNPTSILVRRDDLKNLYSAALHLGILLGIPGEQSDPPSGRQ